MARPKASRTECTAECWSLLGVACLHRALNQASFRKQSPFVYPCLPQGLQVPQPSDCVSQFYSTALAQSDQSCLRVLAAAGHSGVLAAHEIAKRRSRSRLVYFSLHQSERLRDPEACRFVERPRHLSLQARRVAKFCRTCPWHADRQASPKIYMSFIPEPLIQAVPWDLQACRACPTCV